jgi:AraC family transcriptional regulator
MKKTISLFSAVFLLTFLPAARAHSLTSSAGEDVTLQKVEPFGYFCIHHKGPFTEIQEVIGQLLQEAGAQNVFPAGPMLGIYYNNPAQVSPESLEWELGFPVTPQALVQPPLEKKVWNFTEVAAALHTGSYETTGDTITKVLDWMDANGYVQAGPIMERYLDMNPEEIKPEDLKTEVWIPVEKKGA